MLFLVGLTRYLYWDIIIFALSKQSCYSLEMIDTWQNLPYGFSQSMAQKKKKAMKKVGMKKWIL